MAGPDGIVRTRYASALLLAAVSLAHALSAVADTMSEYERAATHTFADYQCGRTRDAIRHAENAVEISRDLNPLVQASALSNLALLYDLDDRTADALAPAEQAVSLFAEAKGVGHRDHVEAMAALGNFHVLVGQFDTAERVFAEALATMGDDAGPAYNLARADIRLGTARMFMMTGRDAEAPALYKIAVDLIQGWPRLPTGALAIAYYRLAWSEIAANEDYPLGEKYLRWVTEVFEQYVSQQDKTCREQFSLYGVPVLVWPIQDDPDRSFIGIIGDWLSDSLMSLAAVQYKQGKKDEAMETLEKLPETDPARRLDESGKVDLLESVLSRRGFL